MRESSRSPSRSPSRSRARRPSPSSDSDSNSDRRPRLKSSQRQPLRRNSETQRIRSKRSRSEATKDVSDSERSGQKKSRTSTDNKVVNNLNQNWMETGTQKGKTKPFTIPKTTQLAINFNENRTDTKALVKETNRVLFDRNISLPRFELAKLKFDLDPTKLRFCSFYQFSRCPVANVLTHEGKIGKGSGKINYAHACATCFRVASILIPHNFIQCPFSKLVQPN